MIIFCIHVDYNVNICVYEWALMGRIIVITNCFRHVKPRYLQPIYIYIFLKHYNQRVRAWVCL
jgi:hypothetical protein